MRQIKISEADRPFMWHESAETSIYNLFLRNGRRRTRGFNLGGQTARRLSVGRLLRESDDLGVFMAGKSFIAFSHPATGRFVLGQGIALSRRGQAGHL